MHCINSISAQALESSRLELPRRRDRGESPPRILLVEDDPATLLMLTRLLRMEGYVVAMAASVTEAVRLSESSPFDLIVSDLGLPDGSGCDVLARVQQIHPVPGIALTGFDSEQDLAHCRDAGFLEQLVKPIDFAHLEQVIRRIIAARVTS